MKSKRGNARCVSVSFSSLPYSVVVAHVETYDHPLYLNRGGSGRLKCFSISIRAFLFMGYRKVEQTYARGIFSRKSVLAHEVAREITPISRTEEMARLRFVTLDDVSMWTNTGRRAFQGD